MIDNFHTFGIMYGKVWKFIYLYTHITTIIENRKVKHGHKMEYDKDVTCLLIKRSQFSH